MAPPRRPATRGRARRRVRKNIAIGQAHIKTSFNNTIVALTDKEGNVIAWESAGSAGFKGSRKSTPFAAQVTADACARKGMEHGLQKVEVFVKGPGSGRETAIRSLQAAGLEIISVQGRDTAGAQRRAAAEAGEGSNGAGSRSEVPHLPPRGPEALPEGERCLTEKCAIERRSYPPGEHGRGSIKQSEYLLQLREKQKARRYYGLLEKQFRNYYEKASAAPASRARSCCGCSRRAWTTSCTGSASQPRARRRASSFATATSTSTAAASTSRAIRFARTTSSPSTPNSSAQQVIRDATDLVSTVAAWLQADHDGLTGKVLKQPERTEIDTPVQNSSSSSSTRSNRKKGNLWRHAEMNFQIPKIVHEEVDDHRGVFVIEPLDRGFGHTFGNSLRRVLLSSLEGAAVTSVKVEGTAHEFTTLPGVREDVTDIVLNLKNLICAPARRFARGRGAHCEEGPRHRHGGRHRGAGGARAPEPGARDREPRRERPARDDAHDRTRPRLLAGGAEPWNAAHDRRDSDRLDLLAGAARLVRRSRPPASGSAPTTTS